MKISVLVPTWNRGAFLQYSLLHLSQQTMSKDDYEVIVLDDGSVDMTRDVIKKFAGTMNLRYIYFDRRHRENKPNDYRSAGPLLNVGACQSKADILLYTDPEVMFLSDAVEHHYLSHVPGHVITTPKYITKDIECHSDFADRVVQPNVSYHVMGFTFTFWYEHGKNFGYYNQNDWVNLEDTYYKFWKIVEKEYGPEYTLKTHKKFDFYGFVGSQGGWSWDKKTYMTMRGFDESFEKRWPGEWGGEDTDFMMRSDKLGAQRVENINSRAIHCYHNKADYNPDKFQIVRELNFKTNEKGEAIGPNMDRISVNLDDPNWGQFKPGIEEIKL